VVGGAVSATKKAFSATIDPLTQTMMTIGKFNETIATIGKAFLCHLCQIIV